MPHAARLLTFVTLLAGLTLGTTPARAQDAPPPSSTDASPTNPRPSRDADTKSRRDRDRADELQVKALRLVLDADFTGAEPLFRELLALEPDSFVTHYNLACVRAMRGDPEDAERFLSRAIELGFCDRVQVERDPMLASLRSRPLYAKILERWDEVLRARRDAAVANNRRSFPSTDFTATDDRARLVYLSAFPPDTFAEIQQEMSLLADWADRHLFPGILDPTLAASDAWCVVVLPDRRDYNRWVASTFGAGIQNGFSTIGGAYEHDQKRLIAQDLGGTLRHEFFHVLHWRSCTRLAQVHPIWIQEGLCSLVEDYDLVRTEGGEMDLTLVPSYRTNIAKRMVESRTYIPLAALVKKSHNDFFNGSRRMAYYSESRAIFLYLYKLGKLKEWYERYTSTFSEDPTGVKAIEHVLDTTTAQFDKDFSNWLRDLPLIPEESRPGMPSLGVEMSNGEGEGPIVSSVPFPMPVGVAKFAPNDCLTHIDGQPTRDLPELLRRLGTLEPGQEVTLRVRRGKNILELPATLQRR
ncbi:MAG: PDZ domain-containing protein [Phycisphaerales bacterium]